MTDAISAGASAAALAGAASAVSAGAPPTFSLRGWFQAHPFLGVFGVWGTMVGGTLAVVWQRPLPLQLKIITARIVAQAGLLGGAAAFGLAAYLAASPDGDSADAHARKVASSSWKLRDYSRPAAPAAAAGAAAGAAAAAALK